MVRGLVFVDEVAIDADYFPHSFVWSYHNGVGVDAYYSTTFCTKCNLGVVVAGNDLFVVVVHVSSIHLIENLSSRVMHIVRETALVPVSCRGYTP